MMLVWICGGIAVLGGLVWFVRWNVQQDWIDAGEWAERTGRHRPSVGEPGYSEFMRDFYYRREPEKAA